MFQLIYINADEAVGTSKENREIEWRINYSRTNRRPEDLG